MLNDKVSRGLALALVGWSGTLGCGSAEEPSNRTDDELAEVIDSDEAPLTQGDGHWEAAGTAVDATDKVYDIIAQADAEVYSTFPTSARGGSATVGITSSTRIGLFRFELRNFVSISSADLMVSAGSGTGQIVNANLSTDAWAESTVTHAKWAVSGAVTTTSLGTNFIAADGALTPLNVTSTLRTNGNSIYTFALRGTDSSALSLNSKESLTGIRPRLRVTGRRNHPSGACPTISNPLTLTPGTSMPLSPAPTVKGTLPSVLPEASGFAASHLHANTYYAHNDSGRAQKIYLVSASGALRSTITHGDGSNQAFPTDWEEIQVGPGPKALKSYIYVGDIGDNSHARSSVNILRMEEPANRDVNTTSANLNVAVLGVQYFDQSGTTQIKLNAEAFVIDPVTGSLYIIEKPCRSDSPPFSLDGGTPGVNRIFKVDAPLPFGSTVHARYTGNFISTAGTEDLCQEQGAIGRPTGAGISTRTGDAIALTFYEQNLFWRRGEKTDVAAVLGATGTGKKCAIPVDGATKREAITFGWDGLWDLLTTHEGTSAKIYGYW
jgi:hypothetical protein